jgi:hypothetical protein
MPKGRPLFSKRDYPLASVVDKLLDLPASTSGNFNILIWTDNRNQVVTEPRGRTFLEYEVGYSSKEEAFILELGERGQRWRYEKVFYDSDVAKGLHMGGEKQSGYFFRRQRRQVGSEGKDVRLFVS